MRRTRLTLPDSPSDVRVTDLDRPLRPPSFYAKSDGFQNLNNAATTPVQLEAGVPRRILTRNPRRTGLRIQNCDSVADLRYSLGNDLAGNGVLVPPRSSDLYDFTTPPDELYLFSTAAIFVIIVEITRSAAPTTYKRKSGLAPARVRE